jgi:hypothetical protein
MALCGPQTALRAALSSTQRGELLLGGGELGHERALLERDPERVGVGAGVVGRLQPIRGHGRAEQPIDRRRGRRAQDLGLNGYPRSWGMRGSS